MCWRIRNYRKMRSGISNKRYLVLGANGYVGADLVRLLTDHGSIVFGVTGEGFRLKRLPLECCQHHDLVVVNCAFWDGSEGGFFEISDYLESLSFYSKSLPTACHVFFSSSSVYEDTIRATESSPLDMFSRYAICKLAVEHFYQRQVQRFVIFRLGQVIGSMIKRGTFFDYVLRNMDSESEILTLQRCNARLSLTADSTIFKSLTSLKQRHSNNIFNISSNLNMTSGEFVQKLGRQTSEFRTVECIETNSCGTWMDVSKAQEDGLLQDSPDTFERICLVFLRGLYR